jgi:YggT family protein
MFVLGGVILGLGEVLYYLLWFYLWVLVGRAIVSWVSADPHNAVVRALVHATDPPLRTVRRLLPMSLRYFPIDVAFLVLVALVFLAQYAAAEQLMALGTRMSGPGYAI